MTAGPEDVTEALRRAVAHHQAGRRAEAERGYRDVLKRAPANADALNLLGVIAADRGDHLEAVTLFDRALAAMPNFAAAHFNKGNALAAAGAAAEALESYKKSIEINPLMADARVNLGSLLRRMGQSRAAIESFREMVRRCPEDVRGYFNLGRCLIDEKESREAIACLETALARAPDYLEARQALAEAYAERGDTGRAIAQFKQVLAANPRDAKVRTNLGTTLAEAGDPAAALACYDEALALDPGNLSARTNRGMTRLVLGQLRAGWEDYAGRHRDPEFRAKRPPKPAPPWRGEDLAGKRILVYGDQGLGDEILYAGMLRDLSARAGAVTLECNPRLVPLFARSFGGMSVVPAGAEIEFGAFDYASSLIDLGQWLRPSFASFGNTGPYLKADAAAVARERARWRGERRTKIGISWHSANPSIGAAKSIELPSWTPLFSHPSVRGVNLQYGPRGAEARDPPVFSDELDLTNDIEGVAARITALDLVVTVSNTTAHLAAALGVPTWVLVSNRRGKLWYWFHDGDFSPWYPAVRIFRYDHGASLDALMNTLARSFDGHD